jgi:hypothetical protein
MNNFAAMTFRLHALRQQFDNFEFPFAQFSHTGLLQCVWAHTIVRLPAVARGNLCGAVPFFYQFVFCFSATPFVIPPSKSKTRREPPLPTPAPRMSKAILFAPEYFWAKDHILRNGTPRFPEMPCTKASNTCTVRHADVDALLCAAAGRMLL